MAKRKRGKDGSHDDPESHPKRARNAGKNHFLDLSDELVLRTLSFLPVKQLLKAERVCQRFKCLAADNEVWKEKFYLHFVRPRARRIPAITSLSPKERDSRALYYASKTARWLEHNVSPKQSVEDNSVTDWKRRYKVKLNWTKGRCKAREVAVDCPYQPRILVKLCQGNIYTADEKKIRSYSQRNRPQILNTHYWDTAKKPTSMSVDSRGNGTSIVVGFSDGSIEILDVLPDRSFQVVLQHVTAAKSAITSISTTWPYVLTLSSSRQLTLSQAVSEEGSPAPSSLITLASLHSDNILAPAALCIRKTSTALVASVAYSISRLGGGCCLGLQEIRLGLDGDLLGGRLTSTIETPMKDFPFRKATFSSRSTSTEPIALHPTLASPPTSLSHSGCYILAGLPDNTLMVYTVVSTHETLEISAGRRLFGHTSSVSGAEVSDRGKALSISSRGDEIRIWELEDMLSSWSLRKTSTKLQPWYPTNDLNAALARRGAGLGLALKEVKDELACSRHWVGFDEEQVIVLEERDQRQILSCYDFA